MITLTCDACGLRRDFKTLRNAQEGLAETYPVDGKFVMADDFKDHIMLCKTCFDTIGDKVKEFEEGREAVVDKAVAAIKLQVAVSEG